MNGSGFEREELQKNEKYAYSFAEPLSAEDLIQFYRNIEDYIKKTHYYESFSYILPMVADPYEGGGSEIYRSIAELDPAKFDRWSVIGKLNLSMIKDGKVFTVDTIFASVNSKSITVKTNSDADAVLKMMEESFPKRLTETDDTQKRENAKTNSPAFIRQNFDEAIDAAWADGITGWRIWKLYRLQKGRSACDAIRTFLIERPDVAYCHEFDEFDWHRHGFLLQYPTCLLIGEAEDAKKLAAEEPELIDACRRENIHVIGGNFAPSFWDAFDRKNYAITMTEYPGTADDAATNIWVTLDEETDDAEQRADAETNGPAFVRQDFEEAIGASYADRIDGWKTWKLYRLQKGWSACEAIRYYLIDRPDVMFCHELCRNTKFLLSEPTYLLIGETEDAKKLAADEPELIDACRRENIHVIGGDCASSFWDAFDRMNCTVTTEKLPKPVNETETYIKVTLHEEPDVQQQREVDTTGWARSTVFYADAHGKETTKEKAKSVYITEYDANGNRIMETYMVRSKRSGSLKKRLSGLIRGIIGKRKSKKQSKTAVVQTCGTALKGWMCPHCGMRNTNGMLFCLGCGSRKDDNADSGNDA